MGTAANTKAELRTLALSRRDALDPAERKDLSKAVAGEIQNFLETCAINATRKKANSEKVLTLFSPIRSEVDLMPLAPILRKRGWTIALPAIQANKIEFRRYAEGDLLEQGVFGTIHPSDANPVLIPDLVIAPLAAFDDEGGRIGYGGGFYDRYLAAAASAGHYPLFVGAAFDCQRIEHVPMEAHDIALNAIVTETGSHMISSAR